MLSKSDATPSRQHRRVAVSGAKNKAEQAEKSDERSGERKSDKTNGTERSAEREVAEQERSGERAESAVHYRPSLLSTVQSALCSLQFTIVTKARLSIPITEISQVRHHHSPVFYSCCLICAQSYKRRRLRGDLIETYKILTGKERVNSRLFFQLATNTHNLRGHSMKLFVPRCVTTARRMFFTVRVARSWNALPQQYSRSTINQRFQEPAGQVLDRVRYGHIEVSTTEPIIYKCK